MTVVLELPWLAPEDAASRLEGPGLAWLDGGIGPTDGRSYLAHAPVETRRVAFGEHDWLSSFHDVQGDALEPRAPRWIGYVAYDAAWSTAIGQPGTPRTRPRHARDDVPILWMGRYDAVLLLDHRTRRARIVADDTAAAARLRRALSVPSRLGPARVGNVSVESGDAHVTAIRRALDHIAAGDIYQVNLARRWTAPFEGESQRLWRAMRAASPVPYGLYLDAGDHAVLARTMERFLEWDGHTLRTKPIKGTIARRGDDVREAHTLRTDEKEQAEHAMIVDLMRNDLGRIAEIGSVRVADPWTVEPYAKLQHLVSTVACRTRPGTSVRDIVAATFPPGSVTGAPKVRAVELIEDLELSARGVYCGAVGFIDRAGGLSLAVAIRTAVVHQDQVRYHAGGGLVAASIPTRELAETELKARVFLDAIAGLRDD